MKKYKVIICSD